MEKNVNNVNLKDFVPISGYEDRFLISPNGEIYSMANDVRKYPILLNPYKNKKGYLRVCFSVNNKRKLYLVHQLVAKAFIPNPYSLPQVNHKNGNKTDNRIENLEWCTNEENLKHAWKYIRKRRLSKNQIQEIIKLSGVKSHQKIADMYSISRRFVGMILSGERYSIYSQGLLSERKC